MINTEISELLERIAGNLEGIAAALDESHPSLSMWARDLAQSIAVYKNTIKKREAIQRFCEEHEKLIEIPNDELRRLEDERDTHTGA